jgi:hypothetical protein
MAKPKSDEEYLSDLKSLYADEPKARAADALQARQASGDGAVDWRADLRLLIGVPFVNLVPDARMLPPESIRFFYADENWLDALDDGACSVGVQSSRDAAFRATAAQTVQVEVRVAAQQKRGRLLNEPSGEEIAIGGTATGFLLRSEIVAGWPGLEVQAFEDAEGKIPIGLARMERLAPDVMLCLFAAASSVSARVDLNEPFEGLQFGVAPRPNAGPAIVPRWPGFTKPEETGRVVTSETTKWVPPVMRKKGASDTRVIDVLATRDNLKARLVELKAMSETDPLTPALFALEMVTSPEQQSFVAQKTLPLVSEAQRAAIDLDELLKIDDEAIFEALFKS